MKTPSDNGAEQRRYKWRYGPLRIAGPPCLAIAGAWGAIKGANALDDPNDDMAMTLLIFGIVAFVVGTGAIFLVRWMARRGM